MTRIGYLKKHNSFQELIDQAVSEPVPESNQRSRDEGDESFFGTSTWGEARDMLVNGWEEGRVKLQERIAIEADAELAGEPERRMETKVSGFMPNVPAYLSGRPQTMWRLEPQESARSPIVRLVVERWATWRLKPAELERFGIAVAALVQSIEEKGYRVELTVSASGLNSNGEQGLISIQAPIKRSDEYIEYDRFAFVFAHAAFLRRIIFGYYETDKKLNALTKSGKGRFADANERKEIEKKCFDANQHHLPGPDQIQRKLGSLKSACAVMAEWWEAHREGIERQVEKENFHEGLEEYI